MGIVKNFLDKRFYGKYRNNWDDDIFREKILEYLKPTDTVLDLGAGAGIIKAMDFKGQANKVYGIDLDPRVLDNPFLDEKKISNANEIPYPDEKFDLVFSDNVLEHLDEPLLVFKEVFRVLKPGGLFLFKTPNKYHYVPLVSTLTPHKFHQYVNKHRGRKSEDTFPTFYKANSVGQIKKLIKQSPFQVGFLQTYEGRPEYLRGFWLSYLVGILYERLVNSTNLLQNFRVILIGALRKP